MSEWKWARAGRLGLAGAALSAGLVLPGCIVVGSSKSQYEGKYFSSSSLDQVIPGETTRDWVLATLGEPARKTSLDDGSEIWKWEYTKVSKGGGYVFPFVAGSSRSENHRIGYVQIRDGIVQKAWQD